METKVTADRIPTTAPDPTGTSVIRVKQGTDELVIPCANFVAAENNAVILQQMFDNARLSPA